MVQELDIETGHYSMLFEVPYELVPGFYSELNGCGISPKDSIIYCAMYSGLLSYVVRLSPGVVEFVARLQPNQVYNTGGFNPAGVLFLANNTGHFLVINNIHVFKGSNDKTDPALADLSVAPVFQPPGWFSTSDVVTFMADFTGSGKEEEYICSMGGPRLQIAKWAGNGFSGSWVIPTTQGDWGDIWGAGWHFNGRIFFSANKGYGVFEIPYYNIKDLNNPGQNLTLSYVGKTDRMSSNDGMNCLFSADPWVTKVFPFDCSNHGAPLQLTQSSGGISVKKLNMETGVLVDVYDLPWTRTDPPFRFLNGVGINPKDSIPYGALMTEKAPGSMYIVRFDWTKIEFVVKMSGEFNPIAGTFDNEGNFFFLSHPDGKNGSLYKVPGLDNIKGYSSALHVNLTDFSHIPGVRLPAIYQMADIVAITYDAVGNGELIDYIVGINRDQQVVVVKWEDDEAEDMKPSNEINLQGLECNQTSTGWGGKCEDAIDGESEPNFMAGSCTSTRSAGRGLEQPAWWHVKLPKRQMIEKVSVTNRGDCCGDRLDGFQVMIDGVPCAQNLTAGLGETKSIPCGAIGSDIKVQIQGKPKNILSLCEVKAFGPEGGSTELQKVPSHLWTFRTNNVLGPYGAKLNFGAAWNFHGRLMFASNDGVGVFEATRYNGSTGSVFLDEIGKSTNAEITDGFNCPSAAPFWGNSTLVKPPTVRFW